MLNKLFKQEWKATWKIPCICMIALAALTLLSILTAKMGYALDDYDTLGITAILFGISMIMYCVYVFCISFVIVIYHTVRFYKNLYTDEGYLMHTLPVTPRQLIWAKTFTLAIWEVISAIGIVVSIAIMVICMITTFDGPIDWSGLWESFLKNKELISITFNEAMGVNLSVFLIYILVAGAVSTFTSVFIIYGCISIGQSFRKHKVMASIVAYIATMTIMQSISSLVSLPLMITADSHPEFFDTPGPYMWTTMGISLFLSLTFGIIGYVLTEYTMKKKLNLD